MPNSQMAHALDGAKLVAIDAQRGRMCAWFGGYSFNAYDTSSWREVEHFSAGTDPLVTGEGDEETRKDAAAEQMEERGYDVIR